jgi:hypothetical protein
VLIKKIWANFQKIIELFTQKIVNKLSKIWVWDPGSEIRKKSITDPGSRGQKGTGSRIRNTGNTAVVQVKTISVNLKGQQLVEKLDPRETIAYPYLTKTVCN